MNRKTVISHVVASVLGLLSGWFGHDMRWLQGPVEVAANVAADAVVPPPAPAPPAAPAPAPAPPADAGAAPAPAPAPSADAGAAPADAGH